MRANINVLNLLLSFLSYLFDGHTENLYPLLVLRDVLAGLCYFKPF